MRISNFKFLTPALTPLV